MQPPRLSWSQPHSSKPAQALGLVLHRTEHSGEGAGARGKGEGQGMRRSVPGIPPVPRTGSVWYSRL